MCAACVCGATGFCSDVRVPKSHSIWGTRTSSPHVTAASLRGSAARSARAAASGSAASRTARTTAAPGAPCATISAIVSAADREPGQPEGVARRAHELESGRFRLGLRRRAEDRADAEIVRIALQLRGPRRGEPDKPIRADRTTSVGDRRVALTDVDAVGPGALDELGTVVQDEERAVRFAGPAKRYRRVDEVVGAELLLAKLDDVDAAAEGGVEELRRLAPMRPRLQDEVEPRAREPRPTFDAVHGAAAYRPLRGPVRRGDRGRRGNRPRLRIPGAGARPARVRRRAGRTRMRRDTRRCRRAGAGSGDTRLHRPCPSLSRALAGICRRARRRRLHPLRVAHALVRRRSDRASRRLARR